jgi:hypothetical protein
MIVLGLSSLMLRDRGGGMRMPGIASYVLTLLGFAALWLSLILWLR